VRTRMGGVSRCLGVLRVRSARSGERAEVTELVRVGDGPYRLYQVVGDVHRDDGDGPSFAVAHLMLRVLEQPETIKEVIGVA
jgi:hypothetical protein